MLLIKEALAYRVSPQSEIKLFLPRDPTMAQEEATSVLRLNHTPNTPLEWRNYFGKWEETSTANAESQISGYLVSLLDRINLRQTSDIVRGLSPISLTLNRGLPSTGILNRWVAPFDWLMSISTTELTQLGDGVAVWSKQDGWGFTQRKGSQNYHSQLLIRQKRS